MINGTIKPEDNTYRNYLQLIISFVTYTCSLIDWLDEDIFTVHKVLHLTNV